MIPHRLVLLDGTEIAGEFGPWRLTQGLSEVTVQVDGIAGGSEVIIWGSNDEGIDAAPSSEYQLGSTISANGITEINSIPRWIRAERQTLGSGATTAVLVGTEFA